MDPPDAVQRTPTATLSPAAVRPYATNCRAWKGSRIVVSGETTICTTGLLDGSVTRRPGNSHATAITLSMSGAFIRASLAESLNVNGIPPPRETTTVHVGGERSRGRSPGRPTISGRRTAGRANIVVLR